MRSPWQIDRPASGSCARGRCACQSTGPLAGALRRARAALRRQANRFLEPVGEIIRRYSWSTLPSRITGGRVRSALDGIQVRFNLLQRGFDGVETLLIFAAGLFVGLLHFPKLVFQ